MVHLLISFFCLISIIALLPLRFSLSSRIYFLVLWVIFFGIAAFRGDVDFDHKGYEEMLSNSQSLIVEPSFIFFSYLINTFLEGTPIYLFVAYAIIGVTIKFISIYKLTELLFFSLIIYLGNFFILHEMTQIRAGVASGFLLLCIKPIYERNFKSFILFAIIAFTFHYSAVVIFPLWILGNNPRKIWLFFSIPISYVIYFADLNLIRVIPIPGVQEKILMYQSISEFELFDIKKTNVFSLVFIGKILIFYILLYKFDWVESKNKYFPILMKVYCLSLISYLIFTHIPAFSTRVSELYGIVEIIIIPFLIYVFSPNYISKIFVVCTGLGFLLITLFYSKIITV